jgi:hypothetical protein
MVENYNLLNVLGFLRKQFNHVSHFEEFELTKLEDIIIDSKEELIIGLSRNELKLFTFNNLPANL